MPNGSASAASAPAVAASLGAAAAAAPPTAATCGLRRIGRDTSAAPPLRRALISLAEAGEAVRLDGSQVDRLGTACLQVLWAGKVMAVREGRGFEIKDPSPAMTEMATLAGLDDLFA